MSRMINKFIIAIFLLLTMPCLALDMGDVNQTVELANGTRHVFQQVERVDPQAEFELGRKVTAELFSRYPPVQFEADNQYLNTLGSYVAQFAQPPLPLHGFHFQLVEAAEPNAFSAPGGFVLITNKMVELLNNEDELAAVLAHEIAHISLRHGVNALQSAKMTRAGVEFGQQLVTSKVAESSALGGVVTSNLASSVGNMVSNLVEKGYSRHQEYDADREAVEMMFRAGYDPRALLSMVTKLGGSKAINSSWKNFLAAVQRSHPNGEDRVDYIKSVIAEYRTDPGTNMGRSQRMQYQTAQMKANNSRPDLSRLDGVEEMLRYPPYSRGIFSIK